jgi:hypothetical protein
VSFIVHAERHKKKNIRLLLNAALKEFASSLKRELKPEKDVPDRFRELIAQLEANSPPNDK